jgi:hypothetical protein
MAESTGDGQPPPDPALTAQIQAETAQAQATDRANDPEDPSTGGIDPRTAQAKLHHAQTATAAATGAGFEFTPEQVDTQLKHCQNLLNDLRNDLQDAQAANEGVYEPAPDAASVAQADAVRNMMANAVNVIKADIAYVKNWQNQLNAARENYLTTEHLSEEQWNRLALGLQA